MADPDKKKCIVANFDCEETWSLKTNETPKPIKKHIKTLMSNLSHHLSVFANDSTEIVMPWRLDEESKRQEVLAWGETTQTHHIRNKKNRASHPSDWQDALWNSRPSPEVAKDVNHKRFAFEIANQNGWQHEHQTFISSFEELDEHIGTSRLKDKSPWLVKAPYSAAGRNGIVSKDTAFAEDEKRHIGRLLERFKSLMVMPWLDRILDFSVSGVIGEGKDWVFPVHFPKVDKRGAVRGIEIYDSKSKQVFFPIELTTIEHVTKRVLAKLKEASFYGPFSFDGFLYNKNDKRRIHPLSEINGRLTFSLVARAQAIQTKSLSYFLEL